MEITIRSRLFDQIPGWLSDERTALGNMKAETHFFRHKTRVRHDERHDARKFCLMG